MNEGITGLETTWGFWLNYPFKDVMYYKQSLFEKNSVKTLQVSAFVSYRERKKQHMDLERHE